MDFSPNVGLVYHIRHENINEHYVNSSLLSFFVIPREALYGNQGDPYSRITSELS